MKRSFKLYAQKNAENRMTSLALRLKKRLGRYREKKKAMENHRELLKLGAHLLRDLGFDKEGNPLNPRPKATINMPAAQAQSSARPPYQGVTARNRPNAVSETRLACLRRTLPQRLCVVRPAR